MKRFLALLGAGLIPALFIALVVWGGQSGQDVLIGVGGSALFMAGAMAAVIFGTYAITGRWPR
ncbi:hypothetical protein SPF06_00930 [Sinomonas sp. JGH33]|uniref:Uncharacterized protein n=1 Tax=Sinomonas terricola TaxID=3110330 RepID=A0ABU5T0U4_9MICC|nr:hypothetical protein [Sinomonas sp. JGH33]MEA5453274.1 hypothetical protein [Sinomonas sp. JGH33]